MKDLHQERDSRATGFTLKTQTADLHDHLCTQLCEGELAPGDTLSIRKVAQEYGCSTMPAREALRWLVAEGALEFIDSRRIIVPTVSRRRFEELLFARRQLETELSRLAFPHLTEEDIETLARIDDAIGDAIARGDMTAYMRGNYTFHFHIYQRSASRVLLPLVKVLWMQYGPSMRYIASLWENSTLEDDYHMQVIEALRHQDCERFCQAIGADIEQGIGLLTMQQTPKKTQV